jgi:hypothetical protein
MRRGAYWGAREIENELGSGKRWTNAADVALAPLIGQRSAGHRGS